ALTSTPYLRAAARMRRHAASRSASLTPSTWSKRAMALRTWRASFSGSLRSFGNANVDRDIRFCCRVLRRAINGPPWIAIPAHRRYAEEQRDRHERAKARARNAGARAAGAARRFNDLCPGGTPLPPDAVPAGSEEHREHQNHEQDEKQSSQTHEPPCDHVGPGLKP